MTALARIPAELIVLHDDKHGVIYEILVAGDMLRDGKLSDLPPSWQKWIKEQVNARRKLVCPHHCFCTNEDTPFFYPPYACVLGGDEPPELGVLAHADASPSNRWVDGTVGVPDSIIEVLQMVDDLPLCVECYEQAKWNFSEIP